MITGGFFGVILDSLGGKGGGTSFSSELNRCREEVE